MRLHWHAATHVLIRPSLSNEREIMDRLKGKRTLITGGTSGIGLETARRFLEEGARVAVTSSNDENVRRARDALGSNVIGLAADAGAVAEQPRVADWIRAEFGRLDAVFVNAGIVDMRPLEQWDEAGFDRSFATNLKGPFFLVQALLPLLANPCSIVLMASINGHIGMANSSVYAATKAAMASLARTLSGELIARGIRVNAVSPGPIATPLYSGMNKEQLSGLIKQIPAGRQGHAKEVADAVVFLASDESGFNVGSEITIDGGMSTL
jgi:NAD(P)-dependent dehydrogenase (short-subunit alcohol dehydrogenase family)